MNRVIFDQVLEIVNERWKEMNQRKNVANEKPTYVALDNSQSEINLLDAGMDSITFIEIIVDFEIAFQISLSERFFLMEEMNTLNKMVHLIEKMSNK